MGRKPNQLILEFFERGPKLEDASNRYQHTCKACGEKFPKGRIDSLTNHLVKKCQAIPVHDRQRALLQLHELPTTIAPSSTVTNANGDGSNVPSKDQTRELPFAGRSPWGSGAGLIGLDALAEASRQVDASAAGQKKNLAYSGAGGVQANGSRKQIIVDPALENLPFQFQPSSSDGEGQFIPAPSLPSIQFFSQNLPNSPSTSPRLRELSLATSAAPNARQSSQLSMIAASANEMMPTAAFPMEPEIGLPGTDLVRDLFDTQRRPSATWPMPPASPENMFFDPIPMDQLPKIEPIATTQRAQTFPRHIAPNAASSTSRGFVNDYGTTKSSKPKVRGRFDPIRRKQVQEVRKQGACIRCRMLRKPCSGETPCNTCRNIESPRMWKHPCIRSRLADEFEAWTSGLHTTLAWVDVSGIKNNVTFGPYTGCIEVIHWSDAPDQKFVTFPALEGQKIAFPAAHDRNGGFSFDPVVVQTSTKTGPLAQGFTEVRLLDSDNDDLPGKLSQYMKEMSSTICDRETSTFMRSTLVTATALCATKLDSLLSRTLELWIANHLLVDGEMHWIMHANTVLLPQSKPLSYPRDHIGMDIEDQSLLIDEEHNPESYFLMCSQLRAALEKRVAQLSKSVIGDLERRLLHHRQTDWFDTVLVSLLLLNSLERTCWLFMSWEEDKTHRWPLDRPPQFYAGQGERFSDILHMQLKMRALPHKTAPCPDSGELMLVDSTHDAANKWYESVQLTTPFLEHCGTREFDANDSRSLDLKYGAKILLPTTCFT